MKKILIYIWPILLRVLLLTLEKEVQQRLYGKPSTRKQDRAADKLFDRGITPPYSMGFETGQYDRVRRPVPKPPKPRFDDEVTVYLEDRATADEILARLLHEIREYGSTGVQDLMDMIGMSEDVTYSDTRWGWENLDHIKPEEISKEGSKFYAGSWSLTFPRPVYLTYE